MLCVMIHRWPGANVSMYGRRSIGICTVMYKVLGGVCIDGGGAHPHLAICVASISKGSCCVREVVVYMCHWALFIRVEGTGLSQKIWWIGDARDREPVRYMIEGPCATMRVQTNECGVRVPLGHGYVRVVMCKGRTGCAEYERMCRRIDGTMSTMYNTELTTLSASKRKVEAGVACSCCRMLRKQCPWMVRNAMAKIVLVALGHSLVLGYRRRDKENSVWVFTYLVVLRIM